MEAEERPHKIRKLSHDNVTQTEDITAEQPHLPIASASTPNPEICQPSNDTAESLLAETTQGDADNEDSKSITSSAAQSPPQALSKNQLRKQRKRQEWEAGREDRKIKRKERAKDKRERKRIQREQEIAERVANGAAPTPVQPKHVRHVLLPITLVIDCGFDDKMVDKERISLGSQVTRAYSDNLKAPYQAHLVMSSWGGLLKERFDTVLSGQYRNWRGIRFTADDFVTAAAAAKEAMRGPRGGKMRGIFQMYASGSTNGTQQPKYSEDTSRTVDKSVPPVDGGDHNEPHHNTGNQHPDAVAEDLSQPTISAPLPESEIIYLTSDSPNTLTTLSPHSTYIIGGLVDKNRHKGICYKTACDRGIKTAKLPIGEFMEMQSRFVLATNHVVEIMIRYLELGDWGEAFMRVIPKRKGGRLKGEDKEDAEVDDNVDYDAVDGDGDTNLEGDGQGTVEDEIETEKGEAGLEIVS